MPTLDPASLLLTNGLLALVLTMMVLLSRIGLGAGAAGVANWIAGDFCLAASRGVILIQILHPGFDSPSSFSFSVLAGTMVMVGIVCHLHALRRSAGVRIRWQSMVGQCLAVALLFCLPALLMPNIAGRLHWLDLLICGVAALTARTCWPMRGLWGARVIGGLMGLAMVIQTTRFVALLVVGPAALESDGPSAMNGGVSLLVFELFISLLVTTSYALLLQERLRQRIERLVVTDALTGVLNRRGLMQSLERELANAERSGRPMSVILFDLDHFKRVNDDHGHAVGDSVLAGFAARVGALMRGGDLFGRWGGEEFLLLLPDTDASDAFGVAERIRRVVAEAPLVAGAPGITVSGGIASAVEVRNTAQALMRMLELADERLYLAKQTRNRIAALPIACSGTPHAVG